MSINVMFNPENRVFIDSGRGCSGGCLYCYLPEHELISPNRATLSNSEELTSLLRNESSFVSGRHGTLISLGYLADPLHQDHVHRTVVMLEQLMSLGNPIQMASKCFVGDQNIAQRIGASQLYPRQLTLLVSMTSFRCAEILEPHAPSPRSRLRVLRTFHQAKINTALLIKPLLAGITDRETEDFREAIKEFEIARCVAGLFYANERIITNLEERGLRIRELSNSTQGVYRLPNDTHRILTQSSHDAVLGRFVEELRLHTGTQFFMNSVCVVAHTLGIPNVTRVWRRFPDLCVACQDCEGLLKASPSAFESSQRGSSQGSQDARKAIDES